MPGNIGTIASAGSAWAIRLANRADGNTDGIVTRDEFVANAPSNVGDATTDTTAQQALSISA